MSTSRKDVVKGAVYKAGLIYDDDNPQYDHYIVCHTGNFFIVDCWVCDKDLNIHPEYNVSPVPILVEHLANLVGDTSDWEK